MNGAVILAGGNGTRFKRKKQFEIIGGKEMWRHVYDKALCVVEKQNVVVVGVDIPGGATRSESVHKGLESLPECDKVVILEAARPLVTVEQIVKSLNCKEKSVTYALPLVNAIIGRDGTYYDREMFYDLMPPQAFDFKLLKKAYETNKYVNTTDETFIMYQEYGIKPLFIVEGENLIKVTYERDIEIIKNLIS